MKPKNFLQRVLDYALSELERRARTPESGDHRMDVRPRELTMRDEGASDREEPSNSAPVQVTNGQERLVREAAPEAPPEAASPVRPTQQAAPVARAGEAGPVVRGLEAVRNHSGDGLTLRWSIQAGDVARARRLVSGKPVLCLRIVSFTRARDDVRREVQDRPGVDLAGECQVAESPERAVVALGLRAGERFISIAHHVL